MKSNKSNPIIVYGHQFCGAVPTVKRILKAASAPYKYLDITLHPEAARHVAAINNGNYSVPTLVFPDKSTLTEPKPAALINKLEDLGYSIDLKALKAARKPNLLRSPTFVVSLLIMIYAVLRLLEII